MTPCRSCNSLCTIPICYGKPGPDLEMAAARGLVELGGCVVEENMPTRRCLDCRYAWITPAPSVAFDPQRYESQFIATALRVAEKMKSDLFGSVAEYGAACIEYGQSRSSEDGSYSSMLSAYDEVNTTWNIMVIETLQSLAGQR